MNNVPIKIIGVVLTSMWVKYFTWAVNVNRNFKKIKRMNVIAQQVVGENHSNNNRVITDRKLNPKTKRSMTEINITPTSDQSAGYTHFLISYRLIRNVTLHAYTHNTHFDKIKKN